MFEQQVSQVPQGPQDDFGTMAGEGHMQGGYSDAQKQQLLQQINTPVPELRALLGLRMDAMDDTMLDTLAQAIANPAVNQAMCQLLPEVADIIQQVLGAPGNPSIPQQTPQNPMPGQGSMAPGGIAPAAGPGHGAPVGMGQMGGPAIPGQAVSRPMTPDELQARRGPLSAVRG